MNFWDFSSWGFFNLMAVLLGSLLVAQMLKRSIPALEASLIPTSVLGGGVLLLISTVFKTITGEEHKRFKRRVVWGITCQSCVFI